MAIAYPDPDYRNEVIGRWKPFLEVAKSSGQTVNTGEYQICCHDGSVRTCELFASFLDDRLIVTFNDITECQALVDGSTVVELSIKSVPHVMQRLS